MQRLKYITLLFIVILFAACGNEEKPPVGNTPTRTADSTDSVKKAQEEEEMAEEIIEGSLETLNR